MSSDDAWCDQMNQEEPPASCLHAWPGDDCPYCERDTYRRLAQDWEADGAEMHALLCEIARNATLHTAAPNAWCIPDAIMQRVNAYAAKDGV